jgi:hypothetical protein
MPEARVNHVSACIRTEPPITREFVSLDSHLCNLEGRDRNLVKESLGQVGYALELALDLHPFFLVLFFEELRPLWVYAAVS